MSERVTCTAKEAAHIVGISLPSLYKAMAKGELVTLKQGARRLILKDDLTAWIMSLRQVKHTPVERPVDRAPRRRPTKVA